MVKSFSVVAKSGRSRCGEQHPAGHRLLVRHSSVMQRDGCKRKQKGRALARRAAGGCSFSFLSA